MAYWVSAITGLGGSGVSVIVTNPAAAVAKANEYREDGFTEILVKDLDGGEISIEHLMSSNTPLAGKIGLV